MFRKTHYVKIFKQVIHLFFSSAICLLNITLNKPLDVHKNQKLIEQGETSVKIQHLKGQTG